MSDKRCAITYSTHGCVPLARRHHVHPPLWPYVSPVVSDQGLSGRIPAEVEPGHIGGCQRLAVAMAEQLAKGD
jgi:hypothetical protein